MRHSTSQFLFLSLGLLLGSSEAASIPRKEACTKAKVVILGAGVAGITAAQTLHNASIHDFIILEHNDYVGGRMKHTTFGKSSDGTPFTVELGANWIEGLQNPSGEINPIWRLAEKHKVKNTYSNDSAIITYDETGVSDFTDLIDLFDEKFEIASQDAGYIFTENLQDTSTRAGLSLAGWKPKRDMKMAAADWWGWDFETAYTPEESGFVYGVAGNNATFKHFSDETNLVIDQRGYNAWLVGEANEFLKKNDPRLRLKTTVKKIEYTAKGVKIDTNNGCVEADYAICTFSVGVLQNDAVEFKPTLPRWKREAIQVFQMGTYTKIFMQFNETFWPEDTQYFLYADPEQRGYYPLFQSLSTPGFIPGSNILLGTVVQQQAYEVEQQSDEKTKKEIMEVLRSMFPDKHVPEPTAFMYPRWSMEEWSYGSYSNWPVGMTLEKHQNLRANVDRLWFAGEANSAEFFGYLQGAYFEGQEIAKRITRILNGEESEKSQQMKRYKTLRGTTELDEYDSVNGWSTPLDD
ncbi:polyamine oxidase precursor [Fusarium pseudocircinatum]|uniref:Amine oxidase n=1 Tax=Fusarium pseudocircinatum TaxID=56676 RepID=A0A8H5UKL7_9HYPO|nr:polyamine oxidase precursor [Fusarium pseudocircinatum]